MLELIKISDYIPKQIELERKYHEKLMVMLAILLGMLVDDYKLHPNKQNIIAIINRWYNLHETKIKLLNTQYSAELTSLANMVSPHTHYNAVDVTNTLKIANDFNLDFNQLLNKISWIFTNPIPTGIDVFIATNVINALTADEFVEQLITSANNSVKKYVQSNSSQTVTNLIVYNALNNGYTQYRSGNEQDDRVRPLHEQQNNFTTWHDLMNPPSTGYPGTEYGCRCRFVAFR